MNNIRQHIPNFCDGIEPKQVEFNSLEELLAIDFVKSWQDDPNFHRFSLSHHPLAPTTAHCLMAEFNEGKKWWVVGYLKDAPDWLPEWVPVKEELCELLRDKNIINRLKNRLEARRRR